jgi:hypothetical protein
MAVAVAVQCLCLLAALVPAEWAVAVLAVAERLVRQRQQRL